MTKPAILFPGLKIALRNWPALVWTYVLQLAIALAFSLHLRGEFADILNHSLAAQRLSTGFDLSIMIDSFRRIGEGPSAGPIAPYTGVPIFVLIYLLLTAGTLYIYQAGGLSGDRGRLSTLLSTGLRYFWRFIRLLLIAAPVTAILIGLLGALRSHWLTSSDEHGVIEQALFVRSLISGVLLFLVLCALRLYFDLAEVYTVQLGLRDDRRIRKSLAPAWRAFRFHFAAAYGSFVLIALLGAAAFALFGYFGFHLLATTHYLFMFLLGQIGVFLLLGSRLWQRGMETALAEANPILLPVEAPSPAISGNPEEVEAPAADPVPSHDPEIYPPYVPPPPIDDLPAAPPID